MVHATLRELSTRKFYLSRFLSAVSLAGQTTHVVVQPLRRAAADHNLRTIARIFADRSA